MFRHLRASLDEVRASLCKSVKQVHRRGTDATAFALCPLLYFEPLTIITTHIPEEICKMWFTFQIAAMCLLMAELDSILMLTVYAPHNKDRRVGSLFMVLFSSRSAWRQYAEAVCGERAVNAPYNAVYDSKIQSYVVYFCLRTLLVHGSSDKNGVLVFVCGISAFLFGLRTYAWGVDCCQVRPHEDGDAGYTGRHSWSGTQSSPPSLQIALFMTLAPYALINQVLKVHILFGCIRDRALFAANTAGCSPPSLPAHGTATDPQTKATKLKTKKTAPTGSAAFRAPIVVFTVPPVFAPRVICTSRTSTSTTSWDAGGADGISAAVALPVAPSCTLAAENTLPLAVDGSCEPSIFVTVTPHPRPCPRHTRL
ncbi:LOW QUALITY PROTEIN: hypothetical protein CVT25_013341 [Psilocybe cyanescens]|uniref:Uncharacterized protein n=1 Tax=Psilocybe cyanescens TaxID=93625 RepID=A0A409WT45_PSICY|nr:LOW QUALITY PROTEIN: hypothetical protein CVT25_013341 [Psilocybe cyanescens]